MENKHKIRHQRAILLDAILKEQNGDPLSKRELLAELEKRSGDLLIDKTFNNLVKYVIDTFDAPIERVGKGKATKYVYTSFSDDLFKSKVSKDEVFSLEIAFELLNGLSEFPLSNDLNKLLNKLRETLSFDENQSSEIIQFERSSQVYSKELFLDLFDCIKNQTAIVIDYKGFNFENTIQKIIHPYLLKQFNQRWFLIGYNDKEKRIENLPLDRILKIKPSSLVYSRIDIFDSNLWFDDLFGVTKMGEKQKVILKFDSNRYNYFITKPFLPFKEIKVLENSDVIIEMNGYINREVQAEILSYGKDIEILEPIELRNQTKAILKERIKNY